MKKRLFFAHAQTLIIIIIVIICFHAQPFFFLFFSKYAKNIQELTKWDSIAGDGDCGTTFKRGAEALIAVLDAGHLPKADLRALLRALSERCTTPF